MVIHFRLFVNCSENILKLGKYVSHILAEKLRWQSMRFSISWIFVMFTPRSILVRRRIKLKRFFSFFGIHFSAKSSLPVRSAKKIFFLFWDSFFGEKFFTRTISQKFIRTKIWYHNKNIFSLKHAKLKRDSRFNFTVITIFFQKNRFFIKLSLVLVPFV